MEYGIQFFKTQLVFKYSLIKMQTHVHQVTFEINKRLKGEGNLTLFYSLHPPLGLKKNYELY